MKNSPFKPLIPLFAVCLVAGLVGCTGGGPTDADPVRVTVTAVPKSTAPGQSVTLLWKFELAEGWHLYWTGVNDSGYPPKVELDLPEGWIAGGLQWPVPERYEMEGGILDHVYHHDFVLLQRIGVPADAVPGEEFVIQADVGWLACKESCVPGTDPVTFNLVVADIAGFGATEGPTAVELAAARDKLPRPAPEDLFETTWDGPVLDLSAAGARQLTFMPTEDCGALRDLLRDGRGPRLRLEFRPEKGTVGPARGLVTLEPEDGPARTYRIDIPAVALPAASPGG